MDGDIVFYIHGDAIEYGGELFSTGELTADILNLSLKDYQRIHKNIQCMKDLAEQYERTQDREFWWKLNHQFVALRKRMMEFRVFRILLRDDSKFFDETQQYTEFRSLLPEEDLDYEDFSIEQWGRHGGAGGDNRPDPSSASDYSRRAENEVELLSEADEAL